MFSRGPAWEKSGHRVARAGEPPSRARSRLASL